MILPESKQNEPVVISKQKEVKQGFIGRILLQKGQHLYELNPVTMWYEEVKCETVVNIKGVVKRKYNTKPGHYYVVALNLKNAERKFIKMFTKCQS